VCLSPPKASRLRQVLHIDHCSTRGQKKFGPAWYTSYDQRFKSTMQDSHEPRGHLVRQVQTVAHVADDADAGTCPLSVLSPLDSSLLCLNLALPLHDSHAFASPEAAKHRHHGIWKPPDLVTNSDLTTYTALLNAHMQGASIAMLMMPYKLPQDHAMIEYEWCCCCCCCWR